FEQQAGAVPAIRFVEGTFGRESPAPGLDVDADGDGLAVEQQAVDGGEAAGRPMAAIGLARERSMHGIGEEGGTSRTFPAGVFEPQVVLDAAGDQLRVARPLERDFAALPEAPKRPLDVLHPPLRYGGADMLGEASG